MATFSIKETGIKNNVDVSISGVSFVPAGWNLHGKAPETHSYYVGYTDQQGGRYHAVSLAQQVFDKASWRANESADFEDRAAAIDWIEQRASSYINR